MRINYGGKKTEYAIQLTINLQCLAVFFWLARASRLYTHTNCAKRTYLHTNKSERFRNGDSVLETNDCTN